MAARSSVDSTRTNDPPPRRQLVRVVATSSLPPRRIRSGESKTGWLSGTRSKSCSPVHSWLPLSHTALAAAGRAAIRSSGPARTSVLSMAPRHQGLAGGSEGGEAALDEDIGGVSQIGVRASDFYCCLFLAS